MVRRTNCVELHLKQSRQRRKIFFQRRKILPLWAHCVPFEMIDLRWNGNPNLAKNEQKQNRSVIFVIDILMGGDTPIQYNQWILRTDGCQQWSQWPGQDQRSTRIHSFIHSFCFISFHLLARSKNNAQSKRYANSSTSRKAANWT